MALPAAPSAPPGETNETVMSGGIERQYVLHVPPGYDGSKQTPLVLLFHGFALTGRIMLDYTQLGDVADREGFIVVSPTGTGDPPRWNQAGLGGGAVDDVLFVNDLLDRLNAQLCIDPERTFATGYSNGGGMSMRLACDEPDRIHAAGLIAAVYLDCAPQVPLIAFHGTADPLVSFDGRGMLPAIRDSVAAWATALGCDTAAPEVTSAGEHVEYTTYGGCAPGDGAARLYVVDGGGHTWPGADPDETGLGSPADTTQEIDASELVWQFFSQYR